MKVVFLDPSHYLHNYGLRILAAQAERAGHDVKLIFTLGAISEDMDMSGDLYNDIIDHVKDADVVGLSVYTNYYFQAIAASKLIREHSEAKILWGGVHSTVEPEDALEHCDYVCVSEGEDSIPRLLRHLEGEFPIEEINNLCYRAPDGTTVRSVVTQLENELDAYPFPQFTDLTSTYVSDPAGESIVPLSESRLQELTCYPGRYFNLPEDQTYNGYLTLTTRGCPYRCTYCINNFLNSQKTGKGRFFRHRSMENVIQELEQVRERFPFINLILFFDDNLCARPLEDIQEFHALYKERVNVPFKCNFHPNNVSEEKIDLLVDAGLVSVEMGIESGSKRTNKELYKRPHKNESILECGRIISGKYQGKVVPYYDVIMDNPYETHEDASQTIRFIQDLPRPFKLSHFSLTFFPGTELYERAKADGLIQDFVEEVVKKKNNRMYADQDPFSKLLVSISPFIDSMLARNVVKLLAHPLALRVFNSWLFASPTRLCMAALISLRGHYNRLQAKRQMASTGKRSFIAGLLPPFLPGAGRSTSDRLNEGYR
ncbi:MAG TPA: radical SAM protein [Candidatus Latescibacteria bacterium]|jgi:radical SAM superfamily enzyme YgiQ (UPF0313 family)|nr:radical SAM protein [Candidatus Latescibacterota bacterium]HJP33880.1 radical SAM protein [Candidatus Latescibacterota bacterium]